MTTELFIVSLVVLLLALLVLLLLFWALRNSRNSDVTELQISAGEPARVLTIRTKPEFANQLLDMVLDRVILQVEPGPQPGEQLQVEGEMESGEHLRGEGGSGSGSVLPMRAVNNLRVKLQKWMTAATPPPPASQDQSDDLQWSDAPEHVTPSSSRQEEKHRESQL
ncbi:uncharacterized protein ACO6RY_09200 [Pungitius sinensis]